MGFWMPGPGGRYSLGCKRSEREIALEQEQYGKALKRVSAVPLLMRWAFAGSPEFKAKCLGKKDAA